MNDFIQAYDNCDLPDRVSELRRKTFSDVRDEDGNQYVDLVQEGGGVLGIALTGYTYVLEQVGIRFYSLAGTSAGAINSMMLAALGGVSDAKSEKLLTMLSEQDLFELVDGSNGVRKLIRKALDKKGGLLFTALINGIGIYRTLTKKLGLNPGDVFLKWISREMAKSGVRTWSDLEERRKQPPNLKYVTNIGEHKVAGDPKLAIIASDITTHTKVEFPRMAPLYWATPEAVNPALFVRASMSVPFFFEPMEVSDIPNAETEQHPLWKEDAGYEGKIPPKVKFVDGGMLSNFPINVFHRADGQPPTRPTFGVRLSTYRNTFSEANNLLTFGGAMVSTMRQIYDYDFLLKNPDYNKLICRIDADEEFNWLNFNMDRASQVQLFILGCNKAVDFLEHFEWEDYKDLRVKLDKEKLAINENPE